MHIVTPLDNIGLELNLLNHWDHLLPRIFAADVNIHPFTWIKKIDGRTVTIYNFYYHQKETIMDDVDSVILTTGKMQNDSLYESLRGRVPELDVIGDAKIGGVEDRKRVLRCTEDRKRNLKSTQTNVPFL